MFDLPVGSVMDDKKVLIAPPEMSVIDAAALMAKQNVGAVMVVEKESLVGIFTERDAVFRVIAKGCDVRTTLLREVMTVSPFTVDPDTAFGVALLVMHERGFRHVPVVSEGKPVGIVSARNALDPDLEEFTFETNRRKHYRAQTMKE
jgi:CBS domain-containing protein